MSYIAKIAAAVVLAAGLAAAVFVFSRSRSAIISPQAPSPRNQPAGIDPTSPPVVGRDRPGDPPQTPRDLAPEPPPQPRVVQRPGDAPPAVAHRDVASVRGVVKFDGEAPEPAEIDTGGDPKCVENHPQGIVDESIVVGGDGGLANVVVSVEGGGVPGGPPPTTPAVLDQVGCRYVPRVLAIQIGQDLLVKNSDPFLHNVHTQPFEDANRPENIAMPNRNLTGLTLNPIKTPERFSIKCDVHPWMLAHVSAFDHPFFAVTNEDGRYEIPAGLPDGAYTLVFWHEQFGEQRQAIRVRGGRAAQADAAFTGAEARGAGDESVAAARPCERCESRVR